MLDVINGGKIGGKASPAYGVDVLRYWVASVDYTSDVTLSANILSDVSGSLRKFRNTVRYILGSFGDDENRILL